MRDGPEATVRGEAHSVAASLARGLGELQQRVPEEVDAEGWAGIHSQGDKVQANSPGGNKHPLVRRLCKRCTAALQGGKGRGRGGMCWDKVKVAILTDG